VTASTTLGLSTLACLVVQAVSIANALSDGFSHRFAAATSPLVVATVAAVTRAVLVVLSEPLNARIAAPVRRELRRRALLATLNGSSRGDDATTRLITQGADDVESYLASYVPALILAGLAPLCLLVWLAYVDLMSAVIIAITVALLPVFMVLLGLAAKDAMDQRFAAHQRLASYFGDVMAGLTTLKAHNRSRHALDTIDDAGNSLAVATMATLKVAFLSTFALELLSAVATALVALALGLRLMTGHVALAVALAVLVVTPEVYLPLRRAAARFHDAAGGVGAATALLDLVATNAASGTVAAPTEPPTISVRDAQPIHASRDQGDFEPLTVTVPAGSTLVIAGPSGVGKSTLLRAMAGLEPLERGDITVDGTSLLDLDVAWRQRCAWVPQDAHLPGTTVGDALRCGRTILDERLIALLEQLGLDLTLETALGENGATLSAGQRRRLALARALAGEPTVLLCDEPTAHLDDAAARLVEQVIVNSGATNVVASHLPFPGHQRVELRAPERFRA
jgi:ABC-type transport system involved in cytochrome bd biosynthesis fused ATPase/permease subunit